MKPKVSVIISNRNDVSMLVVTIRSTIEELKPLGPGAGEIIICDNSDPDIYKLLAGAIPSGYIRDKTIKVFRQDFPCLFTARETAAKAAQGDYLLCVDSHMIIGNNMIFDLVRFMNERSNDSTLGFAHAPINWAHQHERVSRHDRNMSKCELGDWGTKKDKEQTITWKGMPWICRKDFFLNREDGIGGYGALSEHKLSWGGGDMHIGIKPWMLGFKNWAVPCSPAIHIGPFPKIDSHSTNPNMVDAPSKRDKVAARDKYRLWSVSGEGPHSLGFLVSCYILGGEKMMLRNKAAIHNRFGAFINIDRWWSKAMEYGANEKKWFDKAKKLTFEQLLETEPWNAS